MRVSQIIQVLRQGRSGRHIEYDKTELGRLGEKDRSRKPQPVLGRLSIAGQGTYEDEYGAW